MHTQRLPQFYREDALLFPFLELGKWRLVGVPGEWLGPRDLGALNSIGVQEYKVAHASSGHLFQFCLWSPQCGSPCFDSLLDMPGRFYLGNWEWVSWGRTINY